MRYAALVQGSDALDFGAHRFYSDAQRLILYRYDDAVLYALAQYLYSLEPPPNHHTADERAFMGQKIYQGEGCTGCHAPPLYTNNKLTLAEGYTPPTDHPFREDILPISVRTSRAGAENSQGNGVLQSANAARRVVSRSVPARRFCC